MSVYPDSTKRYGQMGQIQPIKLPSSLGWQSDEISEAIIKSTATAALYTRPFSLHHHEAHNKNNPAEGLPGRSTHVLHLTIFSQIIDLLYLQIDVEGSDTVAVLKSKIQESQSHPVGVQKIIYSGIHGFQRIHFIHLSIAPSGKILTDDKTIESCGIKEKDFLVLMVSKVR